MAVASFFNGYPFVLLSASFGDELDTDVTYVHIPGTNITYGDVSGLIQNTIPVGMFFQNEADYFNMRNQVAALGTLVLPTGTFTNVLLKSLKRKSRVPVTGQTMADAEFVASD